MKTHDPQNERIKRAYLVYLRQAKRRCESSIDKVAAALHQFESYNGFKEFKRFHIRQAIGFKAWLDEAVNHRTGKPLSKSTINSTLSAVKAFFQWLAGQPGYKSRLTYSDCEYFNLSEKEVRVATARRERPAPSVEQIEHVVGAMPETTDIELRDRAVIAFALVSGARDQAIVSMKLKHVDLVEERVIQDARDVETKFSKSFVTWFFPVGDRHKEIVGDWVRHLESELLWGPEDPLFPATKVELDHNQRFQAVGLARRRWSNADPIRRIFRSAFERAGLPYFNPHSFRTTLMQLAHRRRLTVEELKAWSQNLGHEQVLTSLTSYGQVSSTRQAELMQKLARDEEPDDRTMDIARQLMQLRG